MFIHRIPIDPGRWILWQDCQGEKSGTVEHTQANTVRHQQRFIVFIQLT